MTTRNVMMKLTTAVAAMVTTATAIHTPVIDSAWWPTVSMVVLFITGKIYISTSMNEEKMVSALYVKMLQQFRDIQYKNKKISLITIAINLARFNYLNYAP